MSLKLHQPKNRCKWEVDQTLRVTVGKKLTWIWIVSLSLLVILWLLFWGESRGNWHKLKSDELILNRTGPIRIPAAENLHSWIFAEEQAPHVCCSAGLKNVHLKFVMKLFFLYIYFTAKPIFSQWQSERWSPTPCPLAVHSGTGNGTDIVVPIFFLSVPYRGWKSCVWRVKDHAWTQ